MNRREFLRGLVALPVAGFLAAASVSEKEEECEVVDEFIVPPGQELAHWKVFKASPSNANGTTWTATSTQGNTSVEWGV